MRAPGDPVFRVASGVLLAALVVAGVACKRRVAKGAPEPAASIAEPAPSASGASAHADGVIPDPAAFADGGAPRGYASAKVWAVVATGEGAAVLVLDPATSLVLPIFVGGTEALTIRLRMDGEHYERPLTHDLLASVMKELGGEAVKAQIDELRDDTYLGSLFVRKGEDVLQFDARPSDAIAVSLGSGAPLYVAKSVMQKAGVPRADIEKEQDELGKRKKGNPISL
jgi:bifunctional DNase/RNase